MCNTAVKGVLFLDLEHHWMNYSSVKPGKTFTTLKDMIFNLCSHAVTVCPEIFVVVCEDQKTTIHVNLHSTVIFACAPAVCVSVSMLSAACLLSVMTTVILASLSVRRAAASISMHLSLMDTPVAYWGDRGPPELKPGDMGLVGVVGVLGASLFPFLQNGRHHKSHRAEHQRGVSHWTSLRCILCSHNAKTLGSPRIKNHQIANC